MAKVPKPHRWVFWDVDAGALETKRDADYIVPRVLEFGRLVEVQWLIGVYGMDGIHRFLRDVGHPELSVGDRRSGGSDRLHDDIGRHDRP